MDQNVKCAVFTAIHGRSSLFAAVRVARLSRRKQGFESPRERQRCQKLSFERQCETDAVRKSYGIGAPRLGFQSAVGVCPESEIDRIVFESIGYFCPVL